MPVLCSGFLPFQSLPLTTFLLMLSVKFHTSPRFLFLLMQWQGCIAWAVCFVRLKLLKAQVYIHPPPWPTCFLPFCWPGCTSGLFVNIPLLHGPCTGVRSAAVNNRVSSSYCQEIACHEDFLGDFLFPEKPMENFSPKRGRGYSWETQIQGSSL